MQYSAWAPRYERIRSEFGFPFEQEERAAALLESLLPGDAHPDPLSRIRDRLERREVIISGLAPAAGPPPVWRRPAGARPSAIVAADGATTACLAAGIVPSVIVTDLDGPIPSEVAANRRGSLVVVHAHGDNMAALREWVPQFPGEIVGSWAGAPRGTLLNVGGFTDGDRAAYLAAHVGASRILLWGFDFDQVEETDPTTRARKLSKLGWARCLLNELAELGPVPILTWNADGSLVPYGPGR
ncbi:MAG: 6-hydroxymethylpterin diphosphokinase MptE-like protein [Thermoplasmata archaeon]